MSDTTQRANIVYHFFLHPSEGVLVILRAFLPAGGWHDLIFFDSQVELDRARDRLVEMAGLSPEEGQARVTGIIAEARAWAQQQQQSVPAAADPDDFLAGVIDFASLATQTFSHDWLVEPLLVRGQPAVVGGPKKCLKSSLGVDLVVSLATGTPFLGRFTVPRPARSLFFTGESGRATVKETALRVCAARHVDGQSVRDGLLGDDLPPLHDPAALDRLGRFIQAKGVEVVIIDPLYLCMTGGRRGASASNLFEVGPLLRRANQACLAAGATSIFVHHAGKGAAARRAQCGAALDLDDLAYAGIAEIVRQWLLVSRREEYVPGSGTHQLWMSVGGSAGQSGLWALDVEEGTLGADFQGRRWDVKATPAEELKREASDAQARQDLAGRQAREEAARQEVLELLRASPEGETKSGLIAAAACGKLAVVAAIKQLSEAGSIIETKVRKPGGRGYKSYDGWKLAAPAEPVAEDGATGSEAESVSTDSADGTEGEAVDSGGEPAPAGPTDEAGTAESPAA